MQTRWTRAGFAVLLSMVVAAPAGHLRAQAPAPAQAPAAPPEALPISELAEAVQRFAATLDAVADYEKLLTGVEAFRAAMPKCSPDGSAQSLGEALVWSVDASMQADRDLARGKEALTSCRLGTAEDALEGLAQQRSQVAQMINVFAAMPVVPSPSNDFDRAFEQTRWIAALRSDAVELSDLARRLDESAIQEPALAPRLAQARRLVEISSRADDVLKDALSCMVGSQPVAAVNKIVVTIEPITRAARELEVAVQTSKETTCAAAAAAAAPKPAGPSWLPAAAGDAPKQAAAVAVPSWVPTRDSQATQTSTTRAADVVGEARDRLIVEETQRIEEQSRRYAEARTQRAMEAQRVQQVAAAQANAAVAAQTASLQGGAAIPAVLTAPIGHTQALALAQRQIAQQQENRQKRGRSFLGVLGKVTAAVGAIAATAVTGGLAAPALGAILPTVSAVSAIANAASNGNASNLLGAVTALPLPLPPAAQQAMAAARAGSAALSGTAMPGTGIPSFIPGGAPTGYLPPGPNEAFLGRWQCTATNTVVDHEGRRTTSASPLVFDLIDNPPGLTLSTETGAVSGTVSAGRAVFDYVMPTQGGSCQLRIMLLPQGLTMSGTTNVTCPSNEQIIGQLACQR